MCKCQFSWNFKCSVKETVVLLFLRSTLYIAFSKCIVSWFWFFFFDFPLFTQNASVKVIYSWNFGCFAKGAVILLRSWSTLHLAVWKCIVFLFYIFYLFIYYLPYFIQKYLCKSHFFSWNFSCSAKGAVLLHLLWSTLYVAVSKCIVCWFYFIFVLVSHYSPKMLL